MLIMLWSKPKSNLIFFFTPFPEKSGVKLLFSIFLKMLTLHVSSERRLKVSLTALQNECLAPGSCCHFSENLVSHPPTPTRFWIACPWQTGAEEPYLSVPTCHCTVEHSQLSQRP